MTNTPTHRTRATNGTHFHVNKLERHTITAANTLSQIHFSVFAVAYTIVDVVQGARVRPHRSARWLLHSGRGRGPVTSPGPQNLGKYTLQQTGYSSDARKPQENVPKTEPKTHARTHYLSSWGNTGGVTSRDTRFLVLGCKKRTSKFSAFAVSAHEF
jgi:hypothetical protein